MFSPDSIPNTVQRNFPSGLGLRPKAERRQSFGLRTRPKNAHKKKPHVLTQYLSFKTVFVRKNNTTNRLIVHCPSYTYHGLYGNYGEMNTVLTVIIILDSGAFAKRNGNANRVGLDRLQRHVTRSDYYKTHTGHVPCKFFNFLFNSLYTRERRPLPQTS